MKILSNRSDLREGLLSLLENGQLHQRQKLNTHGPTHFEDYVETGQILKACAKRPELVEVLLDTLAPHRDAITGVLPPGLQEHGLIADSDGLATDPQLPHKLSRIPSEKIRQWVVEDCSYIFGEFSKGELGRFFTEIHSLLKHQDQFIDLGSGLGKVVMTASLSVKFDSYLGVELMPYRHQIAVEKFQQFRLEIERIIQQESRSSKADSLEPTLLESLRPISQIVRFECSDMFTCDLAKASLIFLYSTCFGSLMNQLADKIVNEAREGCLVSTTTYAFNHPGLRLIKHFPANTLAWTEVRVYERVGLGPWSVEHSADSEVKLDKSWRQEARALLGV